MRRRVLPSGAVLLLVLTCYGSASAFETQGRLGIGYDADLNGATLRYFFGQLGFDMTVGFALQTARATGQDADFDMILAPKLVYPLRLHEKINLNVEGGIFLEVLGTNAPNVGTDLGLGFFGGLAPEVLLWDHLAVEVFFGASIALNNLLENQAEKLNVSFGTLGQQLSVVSGAVFRYYF